MAEFDWDPGSFTASPTLGEDDPLRAWANQLTSDDLTRLAAGNDPQAAIESLINRGVPPPPSQITAYAPGVGWEPPNISKKDFQFLPSVESGSSAPIVRTNPDGSIAGNITAPTDPDAPKPPLRMQPGSILDRARQALTPATAPAEASPQYSSDGSALAQSRARDRAMLEKPTSSASLFDPTPDGGDDGDQLPSGATSTEGKRKTKADAMSDFGKSLQGVKAPTAPPLNAVGTPAAPHHTAMAAPNLANILQLIGQQAAPTPLQTLGRLLVAGKA